MTTVHFASCRRGTYFCSHKSKQNAFLLYDSSGTIATSDTAHTRLYGRSNSLREFCLRARATGWLGADLRTRDVLLCGSIIARFMRR